MYQVLVLWLRNLLLSLSCFKTIKVAQCLLFHFWPFLPGINFQVWREISIRSDEKGRIFLHKYSFQKLFGEMKLF